MKTGFYSVGVIIGVEVLLHMFLLVSDQYLEHEQVYYGLRGVTVNETHETYTVVFSYCESEESLARVCDSLPALRTAGIALIVAISLSLLCLTVFLVSHFVPVLVLKRLLVKTSELPGNFGWLVGLVRLQYVLYLYPMILGGGLLLWSYLAEAHLMLEFMSLAIGMITMLIVCFASFLTVALYCYYSKEVKRKNQDLLRNSV